VALAWPGTPDLAALPNDREAFKQVYRQVFPEPSDGSVVTGASWLDRFVHEMQVGDLVAYPSKLDQQVHLGRVKSDYRFALEAPYRFCHQRRAQWLKRVPRSSYSQRALFELGLALTLFQVRNYLDEHLAALQGQVVTPAAEQDETVALVAEEIEATTRHFVLKTIGRELKGHPYSAFVADLLGAWLPDARFSAGPRRRCRHLGAPRRARVRAADHQGAGEVHGGQRRSAGGAGALRQRGELGVRPSGDAR
jgi:restriction system protein